MVLEVLVVVGSRSMKPCATEKGKREPWEVIRWELVVS